MVVLASDFDKSKYLRAEDLKAEKKFRIKEVTVEGMADKEQKLTSGSPTISAAWCSIRLTTAPCAANSAMMSAIGRTRSSSCFQRWWTSAANGPGAACSYPTAEASR